MVGLTLLLTSMIILFNLQSVARRQHSGKLTTLPGPFLSRYTSARNFFHAWKGDLHLDVVRCHRTYGMRLASLERQIRGGTTLTDGLLGPVIRYAPSRVVFNTLRAARGKTLRDGDLRDVKINVVTVIYSSNRDITKGCGYAIQSFERSNQSLFNCLDSAAAASKKKVLGPTTGPRGMALMENSVVRNTEKLVTTLRTQTDTTTDISIVGIELPALGCRSCLSPRLPSLPLRT